MISGRRGGSAARLCGKASPFQAAQPLWSAAACCRFSAASLLALRPLRGQQAGLKKSGSKLPHSKAIAAFWMMAALGLSVAKAATPDECRALTKHGRRDEAHACYQPLAAQRDHYLRAEGYWGLGMYQEANDEFREAVAQDDRNANYRVRWGRLMHERFNNVEAEKLFQEALQRDPKNARACLGLALVSADGYDSKAVKWTAQALALDPRLVEAHELMASLALEDSNRAEALKQADAALQISPEALDAMAVHAAVEVLEDRSPDPWLAKIRQVNPTDGEGCAIIAHHLLLNYRFEDAVTYYRKAVEFDPQLWSARSALGVNLMRLGNENEARRQLELCYDNGFRDAATVNTLRLLDSYKNFITFKDGAAVLRLNKKEAELLHPYFNSLLQRAMAT